MRIDTLSPHVGDQSKFPPRRRRYVLYFILAAFDVFAVCVSLYLNHRIMSIYIRSVEVNQAWVEIIRDTSQLGQLAAAVNAPGNNVFETGRVDAERDSMQQALGRFTEHQQELKQRIAGMADHSLARTLCESVDAVGVTTREMADESEELFTAAQANEYTEAGSHMAKMDRIYEQVNRELFHLREDIALIQEDVFSRQTAAAASLQKFEYVVGGFILLMVLGATYFGYQTAKQDESYAQERELALKRRQAMELRTRVLKQVMAAQEEERRRIARDLHDEIGQSLTSLLIGLRNVQAAESVTAAQARAADLRRVASLALDEVRRMARGLRPSVLDDVGLPAALERLTEDFAQANEVAVDLKTSGLESERLPEATETALYRITQEALTNVARYAHARHVRIRLERDAVLAHLTVSDDGRGFDCRAAMNERSMGLEGMHERAALLDGAVTVESRPGAGTTIMAHIPLVETTRHENPNTASA